MATANKPKRRGWETTEKFQVRSKTWELNPEYWLNPMSIRRPKTVQKRFGEAVKIEREKITGRLLAEGKTAERDAFETQLDEFMANGQYTAATDFIKMKRKEAGETEEKEGKEEKIYYGGGMSSGVEFGAGPAGIWKIIIILFVVAAVLIAISSIF